MHDDFTEHRKAFQYFWRDLSVVLAWHKVIKTASDSKSTLRGANVQERLPLQVQMALMISGYARALEADQKKITPNVLLSI